MNELGSEELSKRAIGAAIAVHAAWGPWFIESVYEKPPTLEREAREIGFERQKAIPATKPLTMKRLEPGFPVPAFS